MEISGIKYTTFYDWSYKMIGRTIRVLEKSPRLAISIFYPLSDGIPLRGLDLYAPCQEEVAAILRDMGVDLENLNITDVLTTSETASTSKGTWPVILFSPGFGIERDMYLGIISNLVSKGYIIVTIGSPHESLFTVYPDGSCIKQDRELADLEGTDYNGWYRLLDSRSRLINLVMEYLDTLNRSDPELKGLFNLEYIAAVGHSLGGAAVLEVARLENRIKAAILLDPSFHLVRRNDVTSSVPVLLLRQEASTYGAMAAVMNDKIACDYIDGQRNAFKALTNANFYRVNGAQHMSFSDVPLYYGDHHAVRVHADTAEAITAFLEAIQNVNSSSTMDLNLSEEINPINSDGDPI